MSAVKITKLPPGEAIGARVLQDWAHRRLAGRSGMRMSRKERKVAAKRTEAEDATARWLAQAERKARRSK
jgi:hypothetical protein